MELDNDITPFVCQACDVPDNGLSCMYVSTYSTFCMCDIPHQLYVFTIHPSLYHLSVLNFAVPLSRESCTYCACCGGGVWRGKQGKR